jgi:hypothetical protein
MRAEDIEGSTESGGPVDVWASTMMDARGPRLGLLRQASCSAPKSPRTEKVDGSSPLPQRRAHPRAHRAVVLGPPTLPHAVSSEWQANGRKACVAHCGFSQLAPAFAQCQLSPAPLAPGLEANRRPGVDERKTKVAVGGWCAHDACRAHPMITRTHARTCTSRSLCSLPCWVVCSPMHARSQTPGSKQRPSPIDCYFLLVCCCCCCCCCCCQAVRAPSTAPGQISQLFALHGC